MLIMEKFLFILVLSFWSSSYCHVLSPLDANQMIHTRERLPIGQRVDGFLLVDQPARYYFTNGNHDLLTIRVTPCESPLFWRLSVLSLHDKKSHWAAYESNGVNSRKSAPHRYLHTWELFSFQGNGEEFYTTDVSSDILYLLDVVSLEIDTNYQVFIWDHKNENNLWPQLPNDPRVDIVSVEEDHVQLTWKPSLGDASRNGKVDYCVFVNKEHNVKTLCAAESKIKEKLINQWKDQEDELQSNALVTSQTNYDNFNNKIMEENVSTDLLATKSFVGGQKVCVGHWTNATISRLKPRTIYYFDVFAINSHTGTSVAYTGTFAETKQKHKLHLPKLPNDEMVNIFLKSKVLREMSVILPTQGSRWLYIHSCLRKVHLQITVNENIVLSQSIQGAHNFKIAGKSRASCIISLKSSKGGPGLVKMFLATSHHNLPFPKLPPNINFSVSNSTCSSATVTWTSGHGMKYCIYTRYLEQNLNLKLIHKHQNSCLNTNTRSKSEKVFCKHTGGHSLKEDEITELKPGKTYLLDLYIIGLYNTTIKFPSRIVRTQGWCT